MSTEEEEIRTAGFGILVHHGETEEVIARYDKEIEAIYQLDIRELR